eukprot:9486560-Pyramimonas_sp.AAC.1
MGRPRPPTCESGRPSCRSGTGAPSGSSTTASLARCRALPVEVALELALLHQVLYLRADLLPALLQAVADGQENGPPVTGEGRVEEPHPFLKIVDGTRPRKLELDSRHAEDSPALPPSLEVLWPGELLLHQLAAHPDVGLEVHEPLDPFPKGSEDTEVDVRRLARGEPGGQRRELDVRRVLVVPGRAPSLPHVVRVEFLELQGREHRELDFRPLVDDAAHLVHLGLLRRRRRRGLRRLQGPLADHGRHVAQERGGQPHRVRQAPQRGAELAARDRGDVDALLGLNRPQRLVHVTVEAAVHVAHGGALPRAPERLH